MASGGDKVEPRMGFDDLPDDYGTDSLMIL